jgi:hypothetical protein
MYIIKEIYDRSTVTIILNGEELKLFPLSSGMRQGCLLSPLLFNIVLEFLSRTIRWGEEIKGIQIRKEIVKRSLFFRWHDLITKRPRKSHLKTLDTINNFRNVTGYKINLQKSVAFLYTNNED